MQLPHSLKKILVSFGNDSEQYYLSYTSNLIINKMPTFLISTDLPNPVC